VLDEEKMKDLEKSDNYDELMNALKGNDPDLRRTAAIRLIQKGEPSIEPLMKEIRNPSWSIHTTISIILSKIGKPSVNSLVLAVKDPEWYVRAAAAGALSEIVDIRSCNALIGLLKDEDLYVRSRAARSLDILCINLEFSEENIEDYPDIGSILDYYIHSETDLYIRHYYRLDKTKS
jgi:HEAT repeat protein